MLGVVALLEREDGQARSHQRRNREHADERAEPVDRAPLECRLARLPRLLGQPLRLSGRDALGQVLALEIGLRDAGLGGPGLGALELGAAHQEARVAVDVPPLARRRREPLVGAKVVPSGGDPVLEPGPPAEQRLVRDLDRRRFGAWVAVEREQPRGTVGIDRQRQPALVDIEGVQLGPLHTPAGVRRIAQGDQAQEQLPHSLLPGVVQSPVESLGSAGDRARDAADRLVGPPGQCRALPPLVELGQCVLKERQGGGLVDHVGDDPAEQALLERCPHPLGGAGNRLLELVQ